MDTRNEIKSYIVREVFTMAKLVEKLAKQYGWSASVPNFSSKLRRDSLRYREAADGAATLNFSETEQVSLPKQERDLQLFGAKPPVKGLLMFGALFIGTLQKDRSDTKCHESGSLNIRRISHSRLPLPQSNNSLHYPESAIWLSRV